VYDPLPVTSRDYDRPTVDDIQLFVELEMRKVHLMHLSCQGIFQVQWTRITVEIKRRPWLLSLRLRRFWKRVSVEVE